MAHNLVEAEILSSFGGWLGEEYPEEKIESLWYDGLFLLPHDGLYVSDEDLIDSVQAGQNVVYQSRQLQKKALTTLSHTAESNSLNT